MSNNDTFNVVDTNVPNQNTEIGKFVALILNYTEIFKDKHKHFIGQITANTLKAHQVDTVKNILATYFEKKKQHEENTKNKLRDMKSYNVGSKFPSNSPAEKSLMKIIFAPQTVQMNSETTTEMKRFDWEENKLYDGIVGDAMATTVADVTTTEKIILGMQNVQNETTTNFVGIIQDVPTTTTANLGEPLAYPNDETRIPVESEKDLSNPTTEQNPITENNPQIIGNSLPMTEGPTEKTLNNVLENGTPTTTENILPKVDDIDNIVGVALSPKDSLVNTEIPITAAAVTETSESVGANLLSSTLCPMQTIIPVEVVTVPPIDLTQNVGSNLMSDTDDFATTVAPIEITSPLYYAVKPIKLPLGNPDKILRKKSIYSDYRDGNSYQSPWMKKINSNRLEELSALMALPLKRTKSKNIKRAIGNERTSNSIIRPATINSFRPQSQSIAEILQNETSAERADRLQKNLQRLMHFIQIVGHVDSYLSKKFRVGVKQIAKMYETEEREDTRRRRRYSY